MGADQGATAELRGHPCGVHRAHEPHDFWYDDDDTRVQFHCPGIPATAAQRVVLADDQFDFWIRMLREAVRTRQMSGLPLTHGYIKCYRDVIRHMEKVQAHLV